MDGFFTQSSYGPISVPSPDKIRLIILFVTFIVIVIVAYYAYKKIRGKKDEVVVNGPFNLKGMPNNPSETAWKYLLNSDQTNALTSNNITCGFFLYVENPSVNVVMLPEGDYSRLQYVLNLGGSVLIKVDPVHQEVIFDIIQIATSTTDPSRHIVQKTVVVKNVPIAKWNQILFSIEGRTLDIYVNGTLSTSALLDNIPAMEFSGIWLNESPDFDGQLALIQAWPIRRNAGSIMDNYQRKTDLRGKPYIPDPKFNIGEFFKGFCSLTGFCGFDIKPTPLEFVDYEFA